MKWPFRIHRVKNNKYTVPITIAAAVIAMGLSLWIGLQQSVWFDEAYSVIVAQHEPAEIIQLASVDVHPPLYYLLLHVWGALFGWNDFALRLLSALALGGTVIIAGLLVRRLFGDRAAITTVVIAALSPLLLRYGFEIRMYALAAFIGVTATYVLVCARAARKNSFWLWAAYALLLAIGLLTQYHLALLWAAHIVWLLYADRANMRQVWQLPWVGSYFAAAIIFLPWLPKFIRQFGNGALANIGQPMNIEQLLGVVSFNVFYKPLWQVNVIETIILLALLAFGVWAFIKAYKKKQLRSSLLLLVAYSAVPIVLFMFISFYRSMYVERYLSQVAIGVVMLIGVLVAFGTEQLKRARQLVVYGIGALVLLAGLYSIAVTGNYNFQRMEKPAVNTAANAIDCVGSTVIAADPYVATELSYYLPPTCDMHFYSEWNTMGGGYAPFSESPLRLSTTDVPKFTNRLFYVYYGDAALHIAPDYHKVHQQTNNGLTVVEYAAS